MTRRTTDEDDTPAIREGGGHRRGGCQADPRGGPRPGAGGRDRRQLRRGGGRRRGVRRLDRPRAPARRTQDGAGRRLRAGQRPLQLGRHDPGDPHGLRRLRGLRPLVAALAREVARALPPGGLRQPLPAGRGAVAGPRTRSADAEVGGDAREAGRAAREAHPRGARGALAADRLRADHLGALRARERLPDGLSRRPGGGEMGAVPGLRFACRARRPAGG